MLKRLAALIFILSVTGNVWAGVCDCAVGSDHQRSTCCDREPSERDTVSAKPCCDENCGGDANVNVLRAKTDSAVKISIPKFFAEAERVTFVPIKSVRPVVTGFETKLGIDHAQIPRPPNLYIRHQSFLI